MSGLVCVNLFYPGTARNLAAEGIAHAGRNLEYSWHVVLWPNTAACDIPREDALTSAPIAAYQGQNHTRPVPVNQDNSSTLPTTTLYTNQQTPTSSERCRCMLIRAPPF
jgi:hypothetical protein